MCKWYEQPGREADGVVSTRVRLARNLRDIPFPARMTPGQRRDMNQKVYDALREPMAEAGLPLGFVEMDSLSDLQAAAMVEPLEEVIDRLKEEMRTRHIRRMQQGGCSITAGFVWSDLLTDLERTADHCSNIAGCILDMARQNMSLHEQLREFRNGSEEYRRKFQEFQQKYVLE